jgi:hypothetical protein
MALAGVQEKNSLANAYKSLISEWTAPLTDGVQQHIRRAPQFVIDL